MHPPARGLTSARLGEVDDGEVSAEGDPRVGTKLVESDPGLLYCCVFLCDKDPLVTYGVGYILRSAHSPIFRKQSLLTSGRRPATQPQETILLASHLTPIAPARALCASTPTPPSSFGT